jgi:Fe-S cluster assembly protein SufD
MLEKTLVDSIKTIDSLTQAQQLALGKFIDKGFPTSKWEEWKYASLKHLNEHNWKWSPETLSVDLPNPVWKHSAIIQTLNGNTHSEGALPQGIALLPMSEFMAQNPAFDSVWKARNPILDQNSLYDLNEALTSDYAVLWVKKGVKIAEPLLHQYLVSGQLDTAVQSKLFIYLEEDSEITWFEQQRSESSHAILSNYVQEIWVSKNAHLTLIKDQDLQQSITHVDHTFIFQQESSLVDAFTFSINAAYLRNNLHFYIDGPQVVSNLNGLYIPGEDQLMDTHSVVDHRMPHSESNELYKGVLMGNATGVFNGKIFVRPDAQKTNAFQSCKNVLASDRATMNTKPQLEIWADDVKCSHGTTTGQLSDEALFYMRSRGISKATAQTLLLLAFVQQVIDKLEHEEIRAELSDKIVNKIQASLGLTLS